MRACVGRCLCFNEPATTKIYTLALHVALPIYSELAGSGDPPARLRPDHGDTPPRPGLWQACALPPRVRAHHPRSEEHTSELQSRQYLVCRLLLETKQPYAFSISHARSRGLFNP